MREQFEKWCYENKWNTFRYPENWENGGEYCDSFVNGAWHAFQEQQNKINLIKEKINMVYNACEDNEMVANLLDEMEGLLK